MEADKERDKWIKWTINFMEEQLKTVIELNGDSDMFPWWNHDIGRVEDNEDLFHRALEELKEK